jgi:hypothetical protein
VRPPDAGRKLEWMKEFLGQDHIPADVAQELGEASGIDDPGPALRAVLNRNPEVRDSWYRYRGERIQTLIGDWLATHGVDFVDPPPWT